MNWTYYVWYKGPRFDQVGGYWRRGPGWTVERWDPGQRDWIATRSAALTRALENGDPTVDEISQAEFERQTAA